MRRAIIILMALLCTSAGAFERKDRASDEDMAVCRKYRIYNEKLTAGSKSLGSGCGPKGYLINFGYFYCYRFVMLDGTFTPKGRWVMRNIRTCLVHALDEAEEEKKLTCENVEQYGIASHFGCYTHSGYCGMPKADKVMLMVYLRGQVMSPRAWAEFLRIFSACNLSGPGISHASL